MSRLQELRETRDKINAEIRMLTVSEKAAMLEPAGTAGPEVAERGPSPEEIIDRLFTHHSPNFEQHQRYETIRDAAKHLAMVIWKNCPYGSDRTAAIRKLRETVMTANAAIALNGLSV